MHPTDEMVVMSKDGVRGSMWALADSDPRVLIQFVTGRTILIPMDRVERRENGIYYLPYTLAELDAATPAKTSGAEQAAPVTTSPAQPASPPAQSQPQAGIRTEQVSAQDQTLQTQAAGEQFVIPVIVEELNIVGKRSVETGRVRISKTVNEREEVVTVPVMHEEVQVERVPVNEFVNTPPPVSYEGETMIVPVIEEVLVVEKRLRVKEELRITRHAVETEASQPVTLRSENVQVERTGNQAPPEPTR